VRHLEAAEVEALVMDPAAPEHAAARQHLAACPECARRLAEEARFELDLHAAADLAARERPAVQRLPAPSWRLALSAAAAIAVLASGAWLLARRGDEAPAPSPPPPDAAVVGLRMVAPDTPCLRDPRLLGPCSDVRLPAENGCYTPVVLTPAPH
jgi:hypothetical protein